MFASCTLGSVTINHRWADEQPPGANTTLNNQDACEKAGYRWYPPSPPKYPQGKCTWQADASCKTGRCFDRGHIVPSGAMGQLFGRSGQSFTMCNIAPQTSVLNECKWMYVEQVVACLGRYHLTLTMAGSLGPYQPSMHFSHVPKPAFQWKLVFLPASQPLVTSDTVLVWVMSNDEVGVYDSTSYCGRACLDKIEKGLGVTFPARIRNATYPQNSTALFTSLLTESAQDKCGIKRSTWKAGDPPPSPLELSEWGPWNVIYAESANVSDLPSFPCPSQMSSEEVQKRTPTGIYYI